MWNNAKIISELRETYFYIKKKKNPLELMAVKNDTDFCKGKFISKTS